MTIDAKFSDIDLSKIGLEYMLVGGIWAGRNRDGIDVAYLCFFPEDSPPSPTTVYCTVPMDVDEWNKFLRQTDLVETEVLSKTKDGKLYKAVMRKCQRQIGQQASWNVFKRAGFRCEYCGRDDAPLTVDHLVLWESGGPSIEDNLAACCRKCNKTRGNTEYGDWLESPYYTRVSKNLTNKQREINRNRLTTLYTIPRVIHIRSQR